MEVVTVATRKPIKPIKQPSEPITDFAELGRVTKLAASRLRDRNRIEATRARRKAAADSKADIQHSANDAVLEPLLDRIFTYVVEHWDELAPRHSPETVKMNVADFKRHIDTQGTKTVDEQTVIEYIENIQNSEMVATLRKVLGNELTDNLVSRLKALVTTTTVTVLDSNTLKSVLKDHPLLSVDGFEISYNSTVSMILHRSAIDERNKKPAITEVRALPNS